MAPCLAPTVSPTLAIRCLTAFIADVSERNVADAGTDVSADVATDVSADARAEVSPDAFTDIKPPAARRACTGYKADCCFKNIKKQNCLRA